MKTLLSILRSWPSYKGIEQSLVTPGPRRIEGAWGSAAPFLLSALTEHSDRVALCVLPHTEQAEAFAEDVALFSESLPMLFPAWEAFDADELPDADTLSQRLAVLKELSVRRRASATSKRSCVIIAPVQAILQPVPSPELLDQNALILKTGLTRPQEEITQWLVERQFQPVRQVEVPGEFSKRGGIIDIFPYASEAPVRVEFFGDEIESLRTFDPGTQRSIETIEEVSISTISRRHPRLPEGGRVLSSLLDYLADDALLVLTEPTDVMSRAHALAAQDASGLGPLRAMAPTQEPRQNAASPPATLAALTRADSRFATLHLAAMPGAFGEPDVTCRVHSVERFGRDLNTTLQELEHVVRERERTIIFCNNAGERQRLLELLADSPVLESKGFEIRLGRLNHGFDWTDLSLALLTHHELFHRYRQRRAAPRYRHTRAVDSFFELDPGDLVVHATHGIGRFLCMEFLERDGDKQECLKIEYADKALLYVPAARIELVQKYVGPSEHRPRLSRLGGKAWQARKQRTQKALQDLAAELLSTQAARETLSGIAHPQDNDWQKEFEAAFPYEETDDQLSVATQVKHDMEQPRPMDRLICGDVGYGKTEIAVRAAFKAITGGRQVAVLVPTTILACQHTETFQERMADYPVVVRMLSRFVTRSDQRRVLEGMADGTVDVVVGTHRLVQGDVHFKDLGLIIIDEEQRFGVAHKERLKQLRERADVLTLTATPIPRTLHMSLLGIRDISSLETPLPDRMAIQTRLMRYDPHRVRQAILHELARDGQVFFVHNRVESIRRIAQEVSDLVPEARIGVGHGQMPERQLSRVMADFVEHRVDVLVCTSIIESGLDIPNANTILIHRADMFGLADLHQLRGRVGRYNHRAYAYLLMPQKRPVTPVAEKRLKAIEEFAELGAGFRIALRDLEIRGAGNILGPQQSGHIAAVGYDMYCRLLERAVRTLRNEPAYERVEVSLSLRVNAFLPKSYVADSRHRVELYRRLHRATDPSELEALRSEMRDRFGEPPQEVERLFSETRLRRLAEEAGVRSISMLPDTAGKGRPSQTLVVLPYDMERATVVLSSAGQAFRRIDETTLHVRIEEGPQRRLSRVERTRISGEFLLSFLTRMLERGLSARTAISEDPEQGTSRPEEVFHE